VGWETGTSGDGPLGIESVALSGLCHVVVTSSSSLSSSSLRLRWRLCELETGTSGECRTSWSLRRVVDRGVASMLQGTGRWRCMACTSGDGPAGRGATSHAIALLLVLRVKCGVREGASCCDACLVGLFPACLVGLFEVLRRASRQVRCVKALAPDVQSSEASGAPSEMGLATQTLRMRLSRRRHRCPPVGGVVRLGCRLRRRRSSCGEIGLVSRRGASMSELWRWRLVELAPPDIASKGESRHPRQWR
jgi:hypothetical protein